MLKENWTLKGRYRIIGHVGAGGQRRVYRALDTKADRGRRDVVVKEFFRGRTFKQDQVAHELMQQEVRILIEHPHPSLPRLHDVFTDKGKTYLVQEFIEGQTLKAYLDENRALREHEAVQLALQIIEAVDYLHSQDPPIVLRDMKPSNVVLRHGRAFVVDLGGAQSDLAVGTDVENVSVSTRGYAPPEGVRARNAFTVDVFSVGVMLHQMLTGYDPIGRPGVLPGVRQLNRKVHPELVRIVDRATAYQVRNRYPSMIQLGEDLKRFLNTAGNRAQLALRRLVAPGAMLGLGVTVLAASLFGLAGSSTVAMACRPSLLLGVAVASWALVVHALWCHWLDGVPMLNPIVRRLQRSVGPVRSLTALVIMNALLLTAAASAMSSALASTVAAVMSPGARSATGEPRLAHCVSTVTSSPSAGPPVAVAHQSPGKGMPPARVPAMAATSPAVVTGRKSDNVAMSPTAATSAWHLDGTDEPAPLVATAPVPSRPALALALAPTPAPTAPPKSPWHLDEVDEASPASPTPGAR